MISREMCSHHSARSLLTFGRNVILIFALAPIVVLPPHAMALPEGGQVVVGDVSTDYGAGTLTLTQTSGAAIMNWADFGIGAGEIVNILQNSPDAALLNRVLGANPSELLGQLNASGRVFLINPNGVIVGKDASINAMEFVASALDVADTDFLNGGDLAFKGDSTASVLNLGTITAANGDVILIAYKVVNQGEINATKGVAALAAGNDVLLSPQGDQRIFIKTTLPAGPDSSGDADGTGVDNSGIVTAAQAELKAAGGSLYGLAINQTGYVRATGVERKDGRVLLTADDGNIAHAGTISAQNADGSGGEVLIGGDFRGQNAAIANAATTTVAAGAVIDVSASAANADAGRAIVWADQQTDFAGKIEGQGGALGGDGAFAEVSGKHILNYNGLADLRAAQGATGTLWLDPDQAIISTASDDQPNGAFNNTVLSTNLATANVVVDASSYGDGAGKIGEIIVNAPVSWTSGNSLTLKAGNSIAVNADLSGAGAAIEFQAMGISEDDSITVDSAATITANTLTIGQNADAQFVGFNPMPLSSRSINGITIDGILNLGTLDIKTENRGIEGDITINNAANAIGTLASSSTAGTIRGDITIVDGSGDLNVTGNFASIAAAKATTISTAGALTLASGAAVASGSNANVVLAAGSGAFTNNAGASAITVGTGGRSLIYSSNPNDTTLGGLSATPVYNKTFAANAPGTITQTGNRILYSLAPTITFTGTDATRNYGSANPTLAFTVTGLVGSDTAGQAYSGAPTISTGVLSTSNAGDYAITTATGTVVATDYDYQIAFVPGTLTVDPIALTVTVANASRIYGDAEPTFSGSITGFVLGQDASTITTLPTYATTAAITSDVGTYAINGSGGTATNYTFSFTPGTLTVNPAALTITADNVSRDYGDANPTFTATGTGLKNSDTLAAVTGLTLTTTAVAASDAGAYTITAANGTATNYTITHANGTLTVDPAAVTVTAADATRTYGASNPTLTGNVTGLKLGQDASVLTNLGYTTTAVAGSDAGSYAITPSGSTNGNYAYTYTPGTLTVDPAALTIAANNASALFNNPIPTFSASYTGLVNGDTSADISGLTLTTTATQGDNVGTYTITAANATNANYTISFSSGILTISNQILTITADDLTRTYGAANPTFTATTTGFVGSDDISILTNPISFTTAATTTSGVGTYTITPSGATATNYNITFVAGTLTVDPALLTITATDFTRSYGDANPTLTAAFTGLVAGDTSADISGLALATTATANSDAGPYTITASGGTNANYTITHANGTLTVDPAAVTVTAADANRTYGASNPTLTGNVTGLKLGQDASVLTNLAYTTPATAGSDAGTYAITPGGSTNTNYAYTYTPGTLTVDPVALTIAANNASALFNNPIPTFSAGYTGLVNGDTSADISGLTLTTTATQGSGVGTYTITAANATNANYTISFSSGILTISNQILTVTADDLTRTYGAANPTFTATTTGFVGSDDISILTNPIVFTTVATTTSGVGTYTITPSGATAPNYSVTFVAGTLTVDPALLTITATDFTRSYGDANPTLTASFTGLVAGDTSADISGLALATMATANSDAGSYTITASGATNANYTVTQNNGTLTVDPAAVTVTAADASRTYGSTNPTLAGNVTGLKLGQDASVLTNLGYTTTAVSGSDAGSYAITPGGSTNTNYAYTYTPGTLTVNPAALTITANNAAALFNEAIPTFSASFVGLVAGDTSADISGLTLTTTATQGSSVGTYTITAAGATNANYTITLADGILTVSNQILTITADNFTRLYGAANPTFTATTTGFVGSDDISILTNPIAFTTAASTTSGVGTYTITPSGATATNYDITFVAGTLTIDPALLTITATDFTRTYGNANPTFTASFSGLVAGDTEADVTGLVLASPATNASNVGTYAITPSGASNANYTITQTAGTLTVDPAALAVTLDDQTRTYGNANPTLTTSITGFKLSDTASVLTGLAPTTTATTASNVGDYAITTGTVTATNYTVSVTEGTLTVDPAALTITANNQTRDYGDANPTLSTSISGFKVSDDASVVTGLAVATAATDASNIGDYTITASGATATNYTISFVPGTLTIDPAALSIAPNNLSRTYGAANPTLTTTFTGLKLSDDTSVVTGLTVTTAATETSDVGTYTITAANGVASNYTITFALGTLTIDPALLTITATNFTRTYGDANPTFTAAFSGLVAGDTSADIAGLVLASPATNASNVGTYAITPSGASNANYTITQTAGTLTIDPAALAIALDDQTREYGNANPTLTSTITGFKLSDTASVLAGLAPATTATTASNVGDYAITTGTVTATNYTVSVTDGTLTVDPASLTITANNQTRDYGDANPTLSTSISGFKGSDDASVLTGLNVATAATDASSIGDYAITASGATATNYTISFVPGTLTIDPAALSVAANNLSRTYGAANPTLTTTFTGLKLSDDTSVVTGLTVTTAATETSAAGTYTITAANGVASNYTVSFAPGTLTIDPALLTITATNFTRTYGNANPTFTASFSGLVAGDTSADISGLVFNTPATNASNVGTYAITPSGASNANYTITQTAGTLTIDPAALAIAINNQTRDYGDANPTLTSTITGFKLTDNAAVLTGFAPTTTATAASNVGDYAITTGAVTATNYTVSVTEGTLTVDPAALTITADNLNKAYGAANPTLTTTDTGYKLTDDASVLTGLTLTTAATTMSNVGAYTITPTGASATNYTISFVPGTLTINPAALNITADSFSRAYGSGNPNFTATFSGLTAGDSEADILGLGFTTTATSFSNIGDYTITPTGATNANYAISFTPGTLTINRAPLTLDVDNLSKVYADLNPTLTVAATGLVLDQTIADVGTLFVSTPATQFSDIGTYGITATLTGTLLNNYDLTINQGQLTVSKRPITAFANSGTKAYGDANPTITWGITGTNPAGTTNLNLLDTTNVAVSTSATTTSGVGSYPTFVTGLANSNFEITYAVGSITVTAAPLTIRAANASRLYGAVNPTFTSTVTGLKLSDTLADVVSDSSFTTAATQTSNVGSYAVTPTGTALSSNYAITFTPGTLTVNRAPLFVVPALSSRLYGDPDPTFALSATGLVNGDTVDVVTSEVFSGSAPTANVGSQPISILGATATNYSLTFGTGVINILPRPLTITADSFTREYGEANPTFTTTFEGLASFDTPAVIPGVTVNSTTTAASSVLASGYGLNPTSGSNSNYTISYVPGRLDITAAPLLIQLGNTTREYGDANAAPSVTVLSGLKLDDTVSTLGLQVTTPAIASSDVGNYPYNATTTNPNYVVNFTGGLLSITPAPLFVNLDDVFRRYGDANPTTYTGLLSGLKFAAPFESIVTVIDSTFVDTDVGLYNLDAVLLTENYSLTGVSGEVRISPRPLTLNFADLSRAYGDENPSQEIMLNALDLAGVFAPGDQPLDVIRISTTTSQGSNVGTYPIQVAVIDSNYLGSPTVNGGLTITPRPLAIALETIDRVYGQANPSGYDSYRISGFANDLLPFHSLSSVIEITAPDITANVGDYLLSATLLNTNYNLVDFFGFMQITPRPITVRLPESVSFLYGDAPATPLSAEVLTPSDIPNSGLTSFETIDDVVSIRTPLIDADAGSYAFDVGLNTNYNIFLTNPESRFVIEPRSISFDFAFKTYGDDTFDLRGLGGDGLASFDTLDALFNPELVLGGDVRDRALNAGYYVMDDAGLDSRNYRLDPAWTPLLVVLPRVVGLTINDTTRTFANAAELDEFLSDQDLVVTATATNLAEGETFDDAFPIIRYQVANSDQAPLLPTIPTLDNISYPDTASLNANPASQGSGVILASGSGDPITSGVTRSTDGFTTDGTFQLVRTLTIFDGYDTESNYVLGSATNGDVTLKIPGATISDTISESTTGFSLAGITLSDNSEMKALQKLAEEKSSITIASGEKPPGLVDFIYAGNIDFGVEIVASFFTKILTSGLPYDFEAGGLLAEITRSENGTLEDVTPFRIQRWFERNADNPAAMGLLAEPLATYTKSFLNKPSATYTDSEAQFANILSGQMTKARNDYAESVVAKHDEWFRQKEAAGGNLTDLFGGDVPYKDFFAEGATDYVTDGIAGNIALTAGAATAGAAATGAVMAGLTGAILPYATSTAGVLGGSIVGGASVAGAGVVASVAVPVAIVAGAIVGSIARGIQVVEGEKQREIYEDLTGNLGGSVDPSSFSLKTDSGKDNVINQAILLGALAGMLYP